MHLPNWDAVFFPSAPPLQRKVIPPRIKMTISRSNSLASLIDEPSSNWKLKAFGVVALGAFVKALPVDDVSTQAVTCQPAGLGNNALSPDDAKKFGWLAKGWTCVAPCYNPGASIFVKATADGQIRCAGDPNAPQVGLGSCQWHQGTNCGGKPAPAADFAKGYTCRSFQYDWCGPARAQLEPHVLILIAENG